MTQFTNPPHKLSAQKKEDDSKTHDELSTFISFQMSNLLIYVDVHGRIHFEVLL